MSSTSTKNDGRQYLVWPLSASSRTNSHFLTYHAQNTHSELHVVHTHEVVHRRWLCVTTDYLMINQSLAYVTPIFALAGKLQQQHDGNHGSD